MIRCTCGREPFMGAVVARANPARLPVIAEGAGWRELSPGSWACPPCLRETARVGAYFVRGAS